MSRKSAEKRRRLKPKSRSHGSEAASVVSRLNQRMVSRWRERPAGREALVESFDRFAESRNYLRAVAGAGGQWAGIPMPLEGEDLVLEPSYPHYEKVQALLRCGQDPKERDDGTKVRNCFYSTEKRCDIVVMEIAGRVTFGYSPRVHHFKFDLHTLGCAHAWGIEQESNAVHTLAELVSHHQFKQYMLTGMFLESSKRSHVTYCFRRLKPTVAMHNVNGMMQIKCSLCMHPIGYYKGSWAGAMCPTDDVIAHLMLMRGDECRYWSRSQQHPAWAPEAGL